MNVHKEGDTTLFCPNFSSNTVFSRNKIREYQGHKTEGGKKKKKRAVFSEGCSLFIQKKCTFSVYFTLLLEGKTYFHSELNTSLFTLATNVSLRGPNTQMSHLYML